MHQLIDGYPRDEQGEQVSVELAQTLRILEINNYVCGCAICAIHDQTNLHPEFTCGRFRELIRELMEGNKLWENVPAWV